MKKTLLTLLLSSLPLSASALDPETSSQVSASEVVINNAVLVDDEINAYVGISECETMVENDQNVGANFTTTFDPLVESEFLDDYYYFSQTRDTTTKIDCDTGELCTDIDTDEYVSVVGNLIEISMPFTELTVLDTASDCTGFDTEFFLRVTTITDSDTINANDVRFIVDTIRPPAPSGLTATATEGTINVEFVPDTDFTDVDEFTLYYGTAEMVAGELAPSSASLHSIDSDDTTASISVALDAGDTIYIGVASNDETDNRSVLSNVVQTTVIETEDFWETYKNAGGAEDGCASTRSNSSWFLIFVAFIFLSKSRKKFSAQRKTLVSIFTFLTLFLVSTSAFAESEIWGSLELKLGGIFPAIDDEFGGSGPYEATFDNESILVAELEFDAHIIANPAILIGAGFHWGYGSVSGAAITPDGSESEDETSLSIMPFRLSAVARIPYLVTEFGIPFAPSFKVGVDAYRWSISDPSGDTATVDGVKGSGWKPGWHASAGIHFLLNFLAPGMASNFDYEWGVNRSYLFAEYMITSIDGFGDEGFDFSDNYWNFGLAFDF